MRMRLRTLTLIVLMATWMVPATGHSCITNSPDVAGHGHAEEGLSHSHSSDFHSEANAGHDDAEQHASQAQGEARCDLSNCCDRELDASVQVTLNNVQPRPKFVAAILLLVNSSATLMAPVLASTAQLRRQQPPPLPYERTRRPLLI